MTRAESKERNRRALLDAAGELVARDGHRARLDEIAERAGLTTGAVYSLFGSKSGLVIALVADRLGPYYEELGRAVPDGADLLGAVDALARHHRRGWDAPEARAAVVLQITLLDMALRDAALGERLAVAVREQDAHLAALLTGRRHRDGTVTKERARQLALALRALLVGLGQGVVLGLAPGADEEHVAAAARALAGAAFPEPAGARD
ncbi:TetR/AcrR family transcriptional regulator [Streptomyces sp. NPDC058052]|uniref:TetR/AcrR family transcriptional regulator n=1 Tax=Streptomyces sp. NPDC058052 TaxID=3346316 RepID=UPI0036E997AB